MTHSSASSADPTATVTDLPPSAKLVFKTLEYEGELTQGGLAEETRLSRRTVRYALTSLEDADVVTSRLCLQDARKSVYSLTSTSEE